MSRTYRNTFEGEKIRRSKDFDATHTGFAKFARAVDSDEFNKKSRLIARQILRNGGTDIHIDVRRKWIN